MENIELTDMAKIILLLVDEGHYVSPQSKEEERHVALLVYEELVDSQCTKDSMYDYDSLEITTKGRAYLVCNPELQNPSVLKDFKFLTSTAISLVQTFFQIANS